MWVPLEGVVEGTGTRPGRASSPLQTWNGSEQGSEIQVPQLSGFYRVYFIPFIL